MKNPKAKGSSFEREIAKILSLWVSNGKDQDIFWRTSISGGRATVAYRKGIDVKQCGDICAVRPEGFFLTDLFLFELKHVKKLALDQCIIKNTGPLATFWKKACKEAKQHNKKPVIIARQNGWPIIVIHRGDLSKNPLFRMGGANGFCIDKLETILKTKPTFKANKK